MPNNVIYLPTMHSTPGFINLTSSNIVMTASLAIMAAEILQSGIAIAYVNE